MRIEIIRSKIAEILESMKIIEEYLPGDVEEFKKLGIIKDGIYKRTEFVLQNVIDICAILNSDLKLNLPETEDDIFENLVRAGIISEELKNKLKLMKGFRNILVHRYGRISDDLAFNVLCEHLQDVYRFIEVVEKFLEGQK
ncbi:type VII toxin-antitoxin system HepT family RNase toxin [Thermococcus sp.]